MNKMYTVLLGLAAFALLVPANAEGDCWTTSEAAVTVPGQGLAGDLYLVNDACQPVIGDGSCTFSIWLYQESNGIAGLQRGDEVHTDVAGCPEEIVADTDIF